MPFDLRNPLDEVLAHSESMVTSRRQTKLEYIYEYSCRNGFFFAFERKLEILNSEDVF